MAQRMNPYNDLAEIRGTSIPMFNQHGTALSQEEREAIAKKKGVCVKCGIKTHEVKMFKRIALNTDHVYDGKCIRCQSAACPPHIVTLWEQKFKPANTPQPLAPNQKFRMAGRLATLSVQTAAAHHGNAQPAASTRGLPPAQRGQPPRGSQDNLQNSGGYSHAHQLRGPRESARPPEYGHAHARPMSESAPSHNSLNAAPQARPPTVAVGSEVSVSEDFTGGDSQYSDVWQVLKELKECKKRPEVVRRNLHRLRNIGDDQAGAIYEVKELMQMYESDPRTLTACCGALWGVAARSDDKKAEAAETGAISTMIDSLKNPINQRDAEFVQWAVGCICCLSHGGMNRTIIADSGAIEIILDATRRHPSSAGVFEWSCRALHSLVYQTEEEGNSDDSETSAIHKNIVSIDEAGGIQVVIDSMKSHASETIAQLWAFKLLWRLQDRGGNEALATRVVEKICKAGGVGACSKVLKARSTTPAVYEIAASLLFSLLTSSSDSIEKVADCMDTTIRKMGEYPKEVALQGVCCKLLSILSSTNRLKFKEADGLKAVVTAMTSAVDNVELQRAGTNVLWKVSYIPAFFDMSFLDESISVVEDAHKANPDDVELLIAACGFIANATTIPAAAGTGMPFKIPIHALSLKDEDPRLSSQGGRALGNICIRCPDRIKRIVDANGIEALVGCLGSAAAHALQGIFCALSAIAEASDDYKRKLVSAGCLDVAKAQIQNSTSASLTEGTLNLMSIMASPAKRSAITLPADIFQVIIQAMKSQMSTSQPLEHACGVMRNLLVVSTPGSTSMNFEGLVDYMMELINSRTNSVDLKREACGVLWAYTTRHTKHSTNNLSNMFQSVLGVMALYKGEEQQYNSELQSIASGALASITACMRDTAVQLDNGNVEEIIAVMYMVMEYDLENIQLLEKFLDSFLNLSFVNEGIVIQCGGIVVVIDAMVEHEAAEGIQERGCAILALLSSTENLQVNLCIAETDGIDMIVSALAIFSSNQRIQVDACKALSHLSVDHESRMLIASQGGLILIVNAMNSNDENVDLLEGACSALLNLSSDAEEQVLSDSNVVESVIKVMKHHPDSMRLQEKALGVLQNVSMRNAGAKQAIAQAGGINAVTMSIKEYMGTPTVLERAFTTMWSLAVLERNQIEIGNAGGIVLVVNGMMANINQSKVQKQACGCLCTLSSNSRNKTLIREAGGVDAIVFAMWAHYDSEVLQMEACRALSSLAVNVQTNEVMIATDGEINAIISAMRLFPESPKLQEHACVALRNFMLSADNAELIRHSASEVRTLMSHAASRFPDKCSERAQQVMASLDS